MSDARRQRIEELFDQALAAAPEARAALLADRCGDDDALRREVESLVASAPPASGVFRATVAQAAVALAGDLPGARVGTRVGPYRLIEVIGEGGMGTVYLAERADDAFHKRVAVKILRWGLASPEATARFRDERQILASLEHPAIVRLLDGGTTEGGLPYLVMELVEGTPLTAHARDLPIRARVELVVAIAAAIQHAHQQLVVHRDIKPGNILIDAAGQPKLLDFGIAKLIDAGTAPAREARTLTGMALLTVEYASPEQARGDAVSVATDVYALGAVLYELLVGHPPQRLGADLLATLRTICEVEPPRPSAVAPPADRRALAGDLDNIVLKALQKAPAARYPSVAALADDLVRYLDGRPVHARAATFGYKAGKFVRRHRGGLALATLIATALAAATVVSVISAGRARTSARVADRRNHALLIEQARQELFAGRGSRALPYLAEVLRQGEDGAALRFLLAEASRTLDRQLGATVTVPAGLTQAAWSPDGARLAVAGHAGYLRVLDADLRELRRLDTEGSAWMRPTWSDDGRFLAAQGNGEVRIWDATTGAVVQRLVGVGGPPGALQLTATRVAVSDETGATRVWDRATGALVLAPPVAGRSIGAVTLSADARALFVGRDDGTIERWDLATGAMDLRLTGHTGLVMHLRAARDGRLISGGVDRTVRIWDGATGAARATLGGHNEELRGLALDRDEQRVATLAGDGTGHVWDLATGQVVATLLGHTSGDNARGVHFDDGGGRLVTIGGDNTFRVWDTATGTLEILIESFAAAGDTPGALGGALDASFAPGGARLVTVSGTELKLWRTERAPLVRELTTDFRLWAARWSPDERRIAVGGVAAAIIDAATGARLVDLDVTVRVRDCDWSPDGRHLVVVGHDGFAVVYDERGGRARVLAGHRGTINSVFYRPDGGRIATAGDDGTARLWDPATGQLVRALPHPGRVLSATWSRDGRRLATAGWDRTLRVWDAATGALVRAIPGGTTQYLDAGLSPDGALLASAGHDGEVTLWRVDTGARVRSLEGHTGPATMVQWSPDGALLLTSGDDESMRIWDPATGKQLAVRPHEGSIMQAFWSRDGRRALSVSHGASVRVWSVERDPRSAAEIQAHVAARSPWRLVDDRLIRAR